MPICSCGTVDIYYEVHREGFPLLMVSGLGGGTWSWYGQLPCFSEFYRTIVFDNRGAGRSGMPPGPYSMGDFTKDALCLLDRLGVEEAFIMGLSMGGMIAQEIALAAPERVRALVLGCTHFGGELRIPPEGEVIRTLVNNAGLTLEQIIDKNIPLFFSERFRREHPERVARYREVQLAAPEQPDFALQAQLAAIQGFDCGERLGTIACPTLIVTGSQDIVVPRENSYLMGETLPGAEVVVIPGAGHAIHVECADALNDLVLHFFGNVGVVGTTHGGSIEDGF
ncbi:MAG: alpha/beta fold hydrolase [Deltaproteobacteria bacterium]|nr:alpha/beta fold hydrolase [Deltaproteobacteria bacterium]